MATNVKTAAMRFGHSNAAPASRASWCGQLQVGDLSVPVKAYAAIAMPPEAPLRQLHTDCGQRIEYKKWCPIGQPWLTVLIDYYSRMIVGFCVGFEPPSYAVLMEGLRHAILPKTHVAEKHPLVKGSWPCYGLPETVVCDRGPDLTSRALENAAFQLGIELDFNPPRMPHLKGTVEISSAGSTTSSCRHCRGGPSGVGNVEPITIPMSARCWGRRASARRRSSITIAGRTDRSDEPYGGSLPRLAPDAGTSPTGCRQPQNCVPRREAAKCSDATTKRGVPVNKPPSCW